MSLIKCSGVSLLSAFEEVPTQKLIEPYLENLFFIFSHWQLDIDNQKTKN